MERPVDTTVSPCLLIQLFMSLSICYLLWFEFTFPYKIVQTKLNKKRIETIKNGEN